MFKAFKLFKYHPDLFKLINFPFPFGKMYPPGKQPNETTPRTR